MTGRRLYDKYVDAFAAQRNIRYEGLNTPVAWPFLGRREQQMWLDMARRLAPRPKRSP